MAESRSKRAQNPPQTPESGPSPAESPVQPGQVVIPELPPTDPTTLADHRDEYAAAHPDIEALRGGPIDLEERSDRPQTEGGFPIVDGYADGPRGVDQRPQTETTTSYDADRELVRSVDDPEALHEPGLDTPAGRLAAIENAARRGVGFTLFGVRYVPEAQTPEATGAPSDAVIPSPAPSAIAASPRRPRTLEDEKAATGYSTSGAEPTIANPRQPR